MADRGPAGRSPVLQQYRLALLPWQSIPIVVPNLSKPSPVPEGIRSHMDVVRYGLQDPATSGDDRVKCLADPSNVPGTDRWKVWAKYLNPHQLGMPLWTEAELIEGCVLNLFSLPTTDPGPFIR